MTSIPPSSRLTSIVFLFALVSLSGCSLARTQTTNISKSQLRATSVVNDFPRFVESECRFDPPPGSVICGDLLVLEDRENPEGSVVSLHAAIFPSNSANPLPDPVIFLVGGGGNDVLGAADFFLGPAGDLIRTERDFILYNQRGVKRSDPYLACPGEGEFREEIFSSNPAQTEQDQLEYEFLLGCRDYLRGQGVNLEFYDSPSHAADLKDLIQVLGYQQANIFGASYGTRLGLTLMRYHPEVIRSAVLDGVLPPQVDFPSDAITSYVVSVDKLFQACSSQPGCAEKYPDLESEFYSALESLKAEPALVQVDGKEVVLNQTLFLDAIYQLLHSASGIPAVPRAIHSASVGDYSLLEDPLRSVRSYSDFTATGAHYSSICRDEVNFDSLENSQSTAALYHQAWSDYFELSTYFDTCRSWIDEPGDAIENTPVVSSVPTLVLTGTFDPITSPAWGQETTGYLENSFYYEFPNMAHGTVWYEDCALSIALNFLDDPGAEPESSCLDGLGPPEFE